MLHLFGKPFVELDGKPVDGLPSSAFLIVGLLALKFNNRADRAELSATLRENSEAKSANGFLRTQILRAKLWGDKAGSEVFATEGGMLVRSTEHLASDLDVFRGIEQIDTASALDDLLSLYRGDFLASVDGEDGTELKQWLHVQRQRLRERFIHLAAEGAERVGGPAADRAMVRVTDEGPSSDEALQSRLDQTPRLGVPR